MWTGRLHCLAPIVAPIPWLLRVVSRAFPCGIHEEEWSATFRRAVWWLVV